MAKVARGWSLGAGGWTEVALAADTGVRIAGAVRTAFPGAVVHAVVTDVLGPNEARIETADGRRLTVSLDDALRVTGWRMTRAELVPAAA